MHQFEQLLACEAWMKYGKKDLVSTPHYQNTFIAMMNNYKKTVQRTDGLGLKTTKFHQTRHIVHYILRFGSPENVNSARNENHHIENIKNPARTTQRRVSTLAEQTAQRYYHKYLIELAKYHVEVQELSIPQQPIQCMVLKGSKCQLTVANTPDDDIVYNVEFTTSKAYHMAAELVSFVGSHVLGDIIGGNVTIGTEMYLLDNNLFRAHPNYRSSQPWHDFCYFRSIGMTYERVAKIWCFMEVPEFLNLLPNSKGRG